MQFSYRDFIKNLKNKSILFCGIGKSNLPFIKMLTNEKIEITAYDVKKEENFSSEILEDLKSNSFINLQFANELIFEKHFDIVIKTPGISFFSEKIKKLKENGSIITSEMEMFFDLCPCKIIGITGSDGKTTTTSIIYEILKQSGKKVHLGGNIGKPLLPSILEMQKEDIAVVELSSFQLMSMKKSPDIAVITNISPNHLDFHKDMKEYIESKKQIIFHQGAFSKTILNFDNEETRNMRLNVRGKTFFFSTKENISSGVWIDNFKNIVFSENGKNDIIINVSNIKLKGKHNLENYLAAIAATYKLVDKESIQKVAKNFCGVEHRMEFVGNLNGVKYYNDSIASTPTRTISGALSLFNKKIILIAGGYDKKVPFDSLAKEILKKVSYLVLMGNTAIKIKNEIEKLPEYKKSNLKIELKENMQNAVDAAKKIANSGDIIVFSPACASFDLYKNFEERGNHFKSIIKKYINLNGENK